MNLLILYGAGGHARVVAEIAESCSFVIHSVIDRDPTIKHLLSIYPVHRSIDDIVEKRPFHITIAIGSNALRKSIVEGEMLDKYSYATLVHQSANLSSRVQLGKGTVVMAGVSINSLANVGEHCIINTNSTIEHDCFVNDYVHISPNVALAGGVVVGEGTHIGIGASVIQNVIIGKWCTIGAGTVIIRDVPDGATVVGNPGRVIKLKKVK